MLADHRPLVLTIPGLGNSGPDHWQTRWEHDRVDCRRVDLGLWDDPHRNTWVNKINLAIHRAGRPVILVAHSLGCLAVAWWVKYEQPGWGDPVAGALLVAPPQVDDPALDRRLRQFAPTPEVLLPFPSIVVASTNDPYCRPSHAERLAFLWGSGFHDAGAAGHINAESGLGDWADGQALLDRLTGRDTARQPWRPAMPETADLSW
jgi:predicted alpha/beta hydrolase family esterase